MSRAILLRPLPGSAGESFAVFVVVAPGQINLTNGRRRTDPENFRHHSGFHPESPGMRTCRRMSVLRLSFTADRVSERIEKGEKFQRPEEDCQPEPDQRSEQQPHHAPVDPVGEAALKPLQKSNPKSG